MEVRLNLAYEQILQLVRQLPLQEKWRLTHEIEQELRVAANVHSTDENGLTEFQTLLLRGPMMSDEQFAHVQTLQHYSEQLTPDQACEILISPRQIKISHACMLVNGDE